VATAPLFVGLGPMLSKESAVSCWNATIESSESTIESSVRLRPSFRINVAQRLPEKSFLDSIHAVPPRRYVDPPKAPEHSGQLQQSSWSLARPE